MNPIFKLFTPLILILSGTIWFCSCKDFIEPSLSDKLIHINAPADNYQSTLYTINFWWDTVDDALSYRLQIVTPDFQNTGALITDTLIKGNKFSFNLTPGTYQWRLRAENGSTQTTYSTAQNFSVLFSSIKQQKVQLAAPGNNLLTNQGSLAFSWGSLYGATKYRLQVDTNSFTDENKIILNQVTPALQANFALPKDQSYQWRVRAENDTAQAQWSAINTFNYDHTPPQVVDLTAPANSQSISIPVTLQWAQSATTVKYRLFVYKEDSTTAYNNSFPMLLTTNSYTLTQGNFGERIYWKVSAIDAAGNESQASVLRSFVLQ
jgi:uncharacterized protein YegP (UPF0339 family)